MTAGSAPAPQLAISETTNRITDSGYSYLEASSSARGNLTNDAAHTYKYDAESRVTYLDGSASQNYFYDGSGLRVKKVSGGTTTVYIFSGSKVIAEYVGGSLSKEYIYAGSQLVATLNSSGTPTYHHSDHLSERLSTDTSGTSVHTYGHYPFGETWYETGTVDKWKFTTYERDSESGLDYAMFRFDSPRLGRFQTPDPLAGWRANPQSLNHYAYVLNDPPNLVDPLGLECFATMASVNADGTVSGGTVTCVWKNSFGEVIIQMSLSTGFSLNFFGGCHVLSGCNGSDYRRNDPYAWYQAGVNEITAFETCKTKDGQYIYVSCLELRGYKLAEIKDKPGFFELRPLSNPFADEFAGRFSDPPRGFLPGNGLVPPKPGRPGERVPRRQPRGAGVGLGAQPVGLQQILAFPVPR